MLNEVFTEPTSAGFYALTLFRPKTICLSSFFCANACSAVREYTVLRDDEGKSG